MKLVFTQPAAASSRAVNDLLNSPTIEDLVDECEAILYEIECRIRRASDDRARLMAVRKRALSAIPSLKPAPVRRRARPTGSKASAVLPKGD